MPMSFIQPALLLALPIELHWSSWNASYWDSLVLMAPSFMAFRVALIVCMHFLLRNIWEVERLEAGPASAVDEELLDTVAGVRRLCPRLFHGIVVVGLVLLAPRLTEMGALHP